MAYNPASLRVKEKTSGLDLRGIVTLIFPDGTVVELANGTAMLNLTSASGLTPFYPTQDSVDPRIFTIPGTDTWLAGSIRMYWNGQRLNTSLLVVGGSGNRTITLDPTVPIPLGSADYGFMEGEGSTV